MFIKASAKSGLEDSPSLFAQFLCQASQPVVPCSAAFPIPRLGALTSRLWSWQKDKATFKWPFCKKIISTFEAEHNNRSRDICCTYKETELTYIILAANWFVTPQYHSRFLILERLQNFASKSIPLLPLLLCCHLWISNRMETFSFWPQDLCYYKTVSIVFSLSFLSI